MASAQDATAAGRVGAELVPAARLLRDGVGQPPCTAPTLVRVVVGSSGPRP